MSLNLCDFVEYNGKKYNRAIFRQKVLDGEIILPQTTNAPSTGLGITNLSDYHFAPTSAGKYASATPTTFEGIVGKVLSDQTKIQLLTEDKEGQRLHDYIDTTQKDKNGEFVKYDSSITQSIHTVQKGRANEERTKENLALAENGTITHKHLEDFAREFVNEDGSFNDVEIANTNVLPVYKQARQFVVDFLTKVKKQDPFARVFPELKIGKRDHSMAGSIDLIAIYSDLSYDKLDWKLIEKLGDNGVGSKRLEEFKKQADIQAAILKSDYGLIDRRIDYMVPMKVHGAYSPKTDSYRMTALECAPFDVKKLSKEKQYLTPVVIHSVKSDKDQQTEVYNKLHEIAKTIMLLADKGTVEEKHFAEARYTKALKIVNDLEFRMGISEFTQFVESDLKLIELLFKDQALTNLPQNINIINAYIKSATLLEPRMKDLDQAIKDEKDSDKKNTLKARADAFNKIAGQSLSLIEKIKNLSTNFRQDLSLGAGLGDASHAEEKMNISHSHMLRMSAVPMKTLQLVTKYGNQAVENYDKRATQLAGKVSNSLDLIKKEFKGDLIKNVYEKYLLRKDPLGRLRIVKGYKDEFWDAKKKASEGRDLKWFKENTIFNQERYDRDLEKLNDTWDRYVNLEIYTEKDKKEAIAKFKKDNNVGKNFSNEDAIAQERTNFGNKYLIGNETWYSEEFNKILASPALKSMYETLIEFNDILVESGAIKEQQKYSFFPGITNSYSEAWQQGQKGGVKDLIKRFFTSITVDEAQANASEKVWPLTKELIREVKIAHINPVSAGESQNADIGRVLTIMSESIAKYEQLSQLEPIFEKLLIAEQQKQVRETNVFGISTGKEVANPVNYKTAKMFTDYMLYGNSPAVGSVSHTILKSFLRFIGLGDRSISGQKAIETFLSFTVVKMLALNISSAASNVVGGTGLSAVIAKTGKYFTTKQWAKSEAEILSRNKKARAAIKYFNARVHSDEQRHREKKNAANPIIPTFSDLGHAPMKIGDEEVQDVIALSILRSSMIDDKGNIVGIKQHVLRSDEGLTMSGAEVEKKVDQLSETSSLYATMKLDKDGLPYWESTDGSRTDIEQVKDGAIESPKVTVKAVIQQVVAQVLGAANQTDIIGLNTVPYARALLMLRTWMFGTGESIFGHTKYEPSSDSYRQGRTRTLVTGLRDNFLAVAEVLMKSLGGDKFAPSIQAASDEAYEKTKEEYQKRTGQEYTETKEEFMHRWVGNIQSHARLIALLALFALAITAANAKSTDTEEVKARSAYIEKYLNKFYNEFSFWFSPIEAKNLFSNVVPAVSVLADLMLFLKDLGKEGYGLAIGDEKIVKNAHPGRRGTELFPVTKQIIDAFSAIDTDFGDYVGVNKFQTGMGGFK